MKLKEKHFHKQKKQEMNILILKVLNKTININNIKQKNL